ncbi:2-enoyl thioester reductase domain-containing protein, partial [Xanthobacter sp. KR7-225]|uniref:MDR family NADPH-dependent oxidoreductase n=1 Tax=Xanthobacter sp. KR7-225 TaxID=3156613 RepID=UPI0032B3DDB2
PADVAECVEVPDPVLTADDQLLVRVDAFPINPADLLLFRGFYPRNPANGDALGNEATGIVEAVGAAVRGMAPGDRVISLRTDNWRELLLLREHELVRLSRDIGRETAAVLKVNPATALLLLETYAALSPGDWVIQNAANSAVGRALIAFAAAKGLRTINVVRRQELADELRALGGDHVLRDGDDLAGTVAALTGGAQIRLAVDAVGGASTGRLAGCLSTGGTLVAYGAMSGEPMRIDPARLVFGDLRARGFWLTRYLAETPRADVVALYQRLSALARAGALAPGVSSRFHASDIKAALAHAEETLGKGKTLVSFDRP